MNKEQFKGQWNQFKGKVKEKWGKLTDDDMSRINGDYDQLLGRMQERYGYEKERAEKEFKEWNWGKTQEEREDLDRWDEDNRNKKRRAG